MIAYKRQKCQNKNKEKREKFKAKKLGRAFANLALAKAQVKKTVIKLSPQKRYQASKK
ncbi:hypothetical protein UNSW3_1874 [Campylobacter concisus UNSW3]|uniref:Uncharacterized protein n=1 Tax=Campylobacter concisus UNSW3 TaxID=1242966 RepID=U2ET77_9BACT|nr:hypothetical protein UNSW3_1874 [Campylobacter concisus UNSW3]